MLNACWSITRNNIALTLFFCAFWVASSPFVAVDAQGQVFACCGANASISYGSCASVDDSQSVSTATEIKRCWEKAVEHFSNNTLDPAFDNVTIASQFPLFIILLSSVNPVIDAFAGASGVVGSLQFNAAQDVGRQVAPVLYPELGLQIIFQFPQDEQTGKCLPLELKNWALNFTLGTLRAREPTDNSSAGTHRADMPGLGLSISGCGREASLLTNFSLSALGYGQPSFSFVTLRDSVDITAVEASKDVELLGYVCLRLGTL